MTDEIQRDTFAGKQRARRTFDVGDNIAFLDGTAVGNMRVQMHGRIEHREGKIGSDEAAHDAGFARDNHALGAHVRGEDVVGGDVTRTAQIFGQRVAHHRFDDRGGRRIGVGQGKRLHVAARSG